MSLGPTRFSAIAMLVSMLSLFVFLVYWNTTNYRAIEAELKEDLNTQMKLATSEYNDTILFKIFRTDMLDRGSIAQLQFNRKSSVIHIEVDSLDRIVKHDSLNVVPSFLDGMRIIDRCDSTMVHAGLGRMVNSHELESDTTLGLVEREIVVTHNAVDTFISLNVDLTRKNRIQDIERIFVRNLENEKLPSKIQGVDASLSRNEKGLIKIVMTDGIFSNSSKKIMISNFSGYIYKKMIPSVMMSLLLLSLVSFAFYILYRTTIEQGRLAAVKNQFVANMTHELKTPISTVGVALESLKKYGGLDDPEKTKEYIDISQRELGRLQILIDKVLKMSALEKDVELVHLENVNLNKTIEDVLRSLKLYLNQNGVVCQYNYSGRNSIVKGDTVHLTNVIYNLVDNAVKYGGASPQIRLSLVELPSKVKFEITDNGIGIPAEYQPKIFDRFFRVPTNDIHDVKGHGLGLNYVASVVKQLNGKIEVDSVVNQGTTFTITLPKVVTV